MGHFLFRREGDRVELIDARVFDSRNEAVAEVERRAEDDLLDLGELFVADVESAAPVVVVRVASRQAEESFAAVVPMADLPPIAEPASMAVRADEPEVEAAATLEAAATPLAVIEVEETIAEAVIADTLASEPPDDLATGLPDLASERVTTAQSWPWDETAATSAAEAPLAEDTPEVLGAPVEEDAEVAGVSESIAPDAPASVTSLLADLEEIVPVVAEASEAVTDTEAPEADVEEAAPQAVTELEEAEPDSPPRAYEAGTSDITELTCDDCIYLNTCPKKGESDPSSCGSFQWRSA